VNEDSTNVLSQLRIRADAPLSAFSGLQVRIINIGASVFLDESRIDVDVLELPKISAQFSWGILHSKARSSYNGSVRVSFKIVLRIQISHENSQAGTVLTKLGVHPSTGSHGISSITTHVSMLFILESLASFTMQSA